MTYGYTKAQYRGWVPHRVHDFVGAHIVYFHHMVKTTGQQPTGITIERK